MTESKTAPKWQLAAEIKRMGYTIVSEIGLGVYGCVYHAINAKRQRVAIKVQPFCSDVHVRELYLQYHLAQHMPSTILPLNKFQFTRDKKCLVTEMRLCEGGSVHTFLKWAPLASTLHLVTMAQSMLSGLASLHRIRWMHMDIKPNNILIEEKYASRGFSTRLPLSCVLTDFGLSLWADAAFKRSPNELVTCFWRPPEMICGQEPTMAADMWSMGLVLFQLLLAHTIGSEAHHFHLVPNLFLEANPKDKAVDILDSIIQWQGGYGFSDAKSRLDWITHEYMAKGSTSALFLLSDQGPNVMEMARQTIRLKTSSGFAEDWIQSFSDSISKNVCLKWLLDIVQKCLHICPAKRWTAFEAVGFLKEKCASLHASTETQHRLLYLYLGEREILDKRYETWATCFCTARTRHAVSSPLFVLTRREEQTLLGLSAFVPVGKSAIDASRAWDQFYYMVHLARSCSFNEEEHLDFSWLILLYALILWGNVWDHRSHTLWMQLVQSEGPISKQDILSAYIAPLLVRLYSSSSLRG